MLLNRTKTFKIGSLITASGTNADGTEEAYVSDLEGWRGSRAEYSTVPLLFQDTEAITEINIPARDISATFHILLEDGWVQDFYDAANELLENKEEVIASLETASETSLRKETLSVRIKEVSDPTEIDDKTAIITIKMIAPNPKITVLTTPIV